MYTPASLDLSIAPFPDNFIYIGCILATFLTYAGCLTNLGLMILNGRSIINASSLFMLSLNFADFLFCLNFSITNTKNIYYQAYAWSSLGCIIDYSLVLVSAGGSMVSLASVAFDRYLAVYHETHTSWPRVYWWLFSAWFYVILLTTIPFWTHSIETAIVLDDHYWSCVANWSGSMLLSAAAFFTIAVTGGITAYSYVRLYLKFRQSARQSSREDLEVIKFKMIRKCVFITLFFYLCWTPVMLNILVKIITGKEYSYISAIAGFLAVCNAAGNPILMLILDKRMDQRLFGWFSKGRPSRFYQATLVETVHVADTVIVNNGTIVS